GNGHDDRGGIDHENVGRASDRGSDLWLSPDVRQGSAVLERRRRQPRAIPPVGHRDQMRSPPLARRRQPQVAVRAKMLRRGLTPFGQGPSPDRVVHPPIVPSSGVSPALGPDPTVLVRRPGAEARPPRNVGHRGLTSRRCWPPNGPRRACPRPSGGSHRPAAASGPMRTGGPGAVAISPSTSPLSQPAMPPRRRRPCVALGHVPRPRPVSSHRLWAGLTTSGGRRVAAVVPIPATTAASTKVTVNDPRASATAPPMGGATIWPRPNVRVMVAKA